MRMNKIIFFCFLLVCPVFCTACSEKGIESYLTIDKERVDFGSEQEKVSIPIKTNIEDLQLDSKANWCRLLFKNGRLEVTVDENNGRALRETDVYIKGGGQTVLLKVRQLGYEPVILIDKQYFEVNAMGGNIAFSVTTNIPLEVKLPSWIMERTAKTRAPSSATTERFFEVKSLDGDDPRQGNIEFVEALSAGLNKEELKCAIVAITQKGLNEYASDGETDLKDDIKLKVISGEASSVQSGEGIEKSFDGDFTTIYHSPWNNASEKYFPIVLTYHLETKADVDYLVYHPRNSGTNGLFGDVEIQYSSDGVNFKHLMDKDFKGSSSATKLSFSTSVSAKSFRFIVKSGSGDGQGFASCSEMEFYMKNLDSFDYKTLFKDQTCSELKDGITQGDIDKCSYTFFRNMAYFMLKNKYQREFRIDEFKSYPYPDIQAFLNKTSSYSLLDNPTGIAVNDNEVLVVLVGDMHGKNISLKVQNLDKPGGDGFGGMTYPLSEGLNKLTIKERGLVYVMYHTDQLNDLSAKPIKIHFASGKVNGYYDVSKHKGRWNELLTKASNNYFDVVGQYAHLTFETNDFRNYAGTTTDELIEIYDKIAYHEMLLLGLVKYNKLFKNRMYFNVMYHSYMYASSHHTGYHQNTMSDIANPAKLKTSACWGPAHEVGHCNQTRPGVLWVGTTEVTNNIMSEYIQTTIFGQPSRIQVENMGDIYRNRYSKAWNGIIVGKRPHADFENVGNDKNDVFCKLIPFWQLELYFGKVLGLTPLEQADKGGFYPDVYEYARTKDYSGMSDGAIQLDFVYNSCVASKMNLLDFFEKWGFLSPIHKSVEDYQTKLMVITQDMIEALKSKVVALGYAKPAVALEYISDNTVGLYKEKKNIIKGSNATHASKTVVEGGISYSGDVIHIHNWQNVVAYEIKDANNQLVFVSSGENSPSTQDMFVLPFKWEQDYKLYAVSALGDRVEILMD